MQRTLLILGCLLAANAAQAAGMIFPDRGARPMSRGGAFTAGPPSLQHTYYNPANLAGLNGTHFLIDMGFIWTQTDFTRAADLVSPSGYPTVKNIAPPMWIPSLFVGSSFGLEGFFLGFGMYGPYAGDRGYDSTGPQRYSIIWLDLWEAVYQLSAAYSPWPWLRVGLGLQIIDTRLSQAQKLTTYSGMENTGPREYLYNDITTTIEAREWKNVNALIGLQFLPLDWLQIGVALRPPMEIDAPATMKVELPAFREGSDAYLFGDASIEVQGDETKLKLSTPLVLRTGFRFLPLEDLDIEFDFVWERWDTADEVSVKVEGITITGVRVIDEFEVADVTVPQNWNSAFSFRLGGSYRVLDPWLTIHAGTYFETSAVPDETASVAVYDYHKFGLAFGASVGLPWIDLCLDVGYLHVFFLDRTVSSSTLRQINPVQPQDPELADVIGNGKYEANHDVFAFSLRYSF